MNHHGVAQRLPVELLSLIFDYLTLQELLSASHVSSFWREVAIRHHTFWGDISLAALSTTALDFFHARLDAGLTRTVTLRLDMCKVPFPARLRSVVLPAISRNLYRVDRLYLEADMAYDHNIFAALRHPAPRLVTFDVYMARNTHPSDALPIDVFAGHAPALRNVQLINVQLSTDVLPAAFSAIEVLKYCFDEEQSFPASLFPHCRALRTLILHGKYCTLSPNGLTLSAADLPKLRFVDLSLYTGSLELMHCLPSPSIAQICAPLTDYDLAQLLLGHLRGQLEVQLDHTAKEFEILFESLETGSQRSFVCARKHIKQVFLPPVYVDAGLLARVQRLRSTSVCVPMLPAVGKLPSCTTVTLTLTDTERLYPPSGPLSTPELRRIEISCPTATRLSAAGLEVFLDAALAPIPHAVEVALDGVNLDGDLAVMTGNRFFVSPRTDRSATVKTGLSAIDPQTGVKAP